MSKNRSFQVAVGFLSVMVACVMAVLAYLLLTLPESVENVSPTPSRAVLRLPTALLPTTTSGLRRPVEVKFIPQEPIKGFSNCDRYGFKGLVRGSDGNPIANIQVVIWEDETGGLLALDTTDLDGTYSLEIQAKPRPRNLWVQVFQNDIPVSEPVLMKTQVDCQNGFQIYQINWQELLIENGE